MEDPGLLAKRNAGKFPWLRLLLVWLGAVSLFAAYGFISGGIPVHGDTFYLRNGVEGAAIFGGFGVGVSTCFTLGLVILHKVRSGRISKAWAVAALASTSVISVPLLLLVIRLVRLLSPQEILGGEREMAVLGILGWMVVAAGASFLGFTVFVLAGKRQPAGHHKASRSAS